MIRSTDSTYPNPPVTSDQTARKRVLGIGRKSQQDNPNLKMPTNKSGIDKLLQRPTHPDPYF